jgi:glycosyltransferase involved in cell wall biosynthesis
MRIYSPSLDPMNSFGRTAYSLVECFKRLGYKPELSKEREGKHFVEIGGPGSSVDTDYLLSFWETDKIRPKDIEIIKTFPQRKIVVTCDDTVKIFQNENFEVSKIILASEYNPLPLPPLSPFTFYTIYQDCTFHERKRAQDIVDAFPRAFPHEEDVRLIMKQGIGCTRLKVFDSRIKVIREALADVSYLHRENHVFVSACGAEGWGYPHHDAISHGRPVICPAIGGPLEFLDNTCAWMVPAQMIPSPGNIYDYTGEIGRLNVDDLAYAMRYAYYNKQEVMEKATGAFVKARNFTLDQMTVSVKKAFNL